LLARSQNIWSPCGRSNWDHKRFYGAPEYQHNHDLREG